MPVTVYNSQNIWLSDRTNLAEHVSEPESIKKKASMSQSSSRQASLILVV